MKNAPAIRKRLNDVLNALDIEGVKLSRCELVWISELAYKADVPVECGIPYMAGACFEYGDEYYYPMHRLAMHWFSRWYSMIDDENTKALMLGFAHIKSEIGDKSLMKINSLNAVKSAVDKWGETLAIPDNQIAGLYDKLEKIDGFASEVEIPNAKKKDQGAVNMYEDITALCQAFPSTTPEYWRSGISFAESSQILDALKLNNGNQSRTEIKHQGIFAFKCAVKWIRKWHGVE